MNRKMPSAGSLARVLVILLGMAVLAGLLMGISETSSKATTDPKPPVQAEQKVEAEPPALKKEPIKLTLDGVVENSGRYTVKMPGGSEAVLTLDPRLQKRAESFFRNNRVPFGALVAIEPATGRVLAYVEYSETDPSHSYYSISKPYLAASLFKIVTAESIISEKRVPIDEVCCYHGGRSRLTSGLLKDNPRRDNRCLTFEQALGHSTNVVFARLAHKNLTPDMLNRHAKSFMFGGQIPFELNVDESIARVPEEMDEMAKTAAGFGNVKVTPLHAAMIAATVGNGGEMMRPFIVEEVRNAEGNLVYAPHRDVLAKVTSKEVAEMLSSMMYTTTTEGTGRKAFRAKRGWIDFKRTVPIAGKTGSLAEREPYFKEYTWYAGFGPVDNPKIAVAALVINHRSWKTKGSYAAREVFEEFFRDQGVYADARHARRK